MDFFIPGVPLARLRAVAMKKQVGGVGYYPTSGSPFVHLDTGNVRAWPRMTKAQLEEIFPDGRTLHIPPSGKPLSQQGYQLARAEWQKCHQVPCGGSSGFAVASNGGGSGGTLMDLFFGGDDEESAPAPVQVASVPQQAAAPAAPRVAPVPMMRPQMAVALAEEQGPESIPFSSVGSAPLEPELMTASLAPVPARKSEALIAETRGQTAIAAIAALDAPVPAPRLNMTNPPGEPETVLTAYAAPDLQASGQQQALERIIETAMVPPLPGETMQAASPATADAETPLLRLEGISQMQTASIGGSAKPAASLLDMTWGAMGQQPEAAPVAQALAELVDTGADTRSIDTRDARFIAPDLEHVAATMVAPAPISSPHFAIIFEHDEADFDPATELGPHVPEMGIGDHPPIFSATQFTKKPLVVAAR
jgi:hypothetical protein